MAQSAFGLIAMFEKVPIKTIGCRCVSAFCGKKPGSYMELTGI
jgi:hypothetical protein